MENHFDKIFYLFGVIIWHVLKKRYGKSYQGPTVDEPVLTPELTVEDEEIAMRKIKAPEAVAAPKPNYLLTHASVSPAATQVAPPALRTTISYLSPSQQAIQPKKIDRVLSRYSGWKKAIVISELLHPPHVYSA
jgi:hypothetical protein